MDTPIRRFFAAVDLCIGGLAANGPSQANGWRFANNTHPRTGEPLALAHTTCTVWGNREVGKTTPDITANLALTAVRTGADAASIRTGAGLILSQYQPIHTLIAHGPTGLVYCGAETAPANFNTCRLPPRWLTTASAPDVALLRGVPRITHPSDMYLFFSEQMNAAWLNGEAGTGAARSPESVLSGSPSFSGSDKLDMGIPWVSDEGMLEVTIPLGQLGAALTHAKGLITPAPAPSDD